MSNETIKDQVKRLIAGIAPCYEKSPDLIKDDDYCFGFMVQIVELAIAEEREASGWQPIETAPKDGTSLLGYWLGGKHECSIHTTKFHCGRWWATNEDYQHSTPSYWIPLPAAPKDEVSE